MPGSSPEAEAKVYWRVLDAAPATEYKIGYWFALSEALVQLPTAPEYPTAGPIVAISEIEWILA